MNRSEMTEIRTGLLDPRRPWTVRSSGSTDSKQASLLQMSSKRIKTSSHDSQLWSSLAFSSTARPTTQVAQEILPRKHCGPYLEHICDWPHQEAAQRTPDATPAVHSTPTSVYRAGRLRHCLPADPRSSFLASNVHPSGSRLTSSARHGTYPLTNLQRTETASTWRTHTAVKDSKSYILFVDTGRSLGAVSSACGQGSLILAHRNS